MGLTKRIKNGNHGSHTQLSESISAIRKTQTLPPSCLPLPPSDQLSNGSAVFPDHIFLVGSLLIFLTSTTRHVVYFTSFQNLPLLHSINKVAPLIAKCALISFALILSRICTPWYARNRCTVLAALLFTFYLIPRTGINKSLEFALNCQPSSDGGFISGVWDYFRLFFWGNVFDVAYATLTLPLPLRLLPLTFVLPLIAMSLTSENVCLAPFLDNPTFAGKIARHTKVLDSVTLSGILKWVGLLKTQEYNAQRQCEVWFSFFRIVLGGVIPHILVLLFRLVPPLQFGRGKEGAKTQQHRNDNKQQQHERYGSWLQRADDCCLFVWKNTKAAFNSSMPPVFLWFIWLSAVWGILAPALAYFMPQS